MRELGGRSLRGEEAQGRELLGEGDEREGKRACEVRELRGESHRAREMNARQRELGGGSRRKGAGRAMETNARSFITCLSYDICFHPLFFFHSVYFSFPRSFPPL